MKELLADLNKNLLYFSMAAFLFIATSAIALSKPEFTYILDPDKRVVKAANPLPVLTTTDKFPILSAQGVIAVDLDSSVTLYEKNADKTLLPASTTKIVTALVALDYYSPDQILEVVDLKVIGQKMGLQVGEKITFDDLLSGLLIYSANDAAEVLAQNYPGGREEFIKAMNQKATELNLYGTHFENPTGLDSVSHVSTARDLMRVATYAMKNPKFADLVGQKEKTVASIDGEVVHKLTNINKLLGEIPGVLGVKTGWTENARENLVTYIERDGHRVMIALLGSQDRFGETEELINWIFENYRWDEVQFVAP